jgi:squalene/oxidosqualene cyclase-like protein
MNRMATDALDAGLAHLSATQTRGGSWQGDYSGPAFLLPMYVGTCYAVGHRIPRAESDGMVRYLLGSQQEDGGWGLGPQTPSTVFTTVLCYVALRLLGVSQHEDGAERARAYFLPRGGALGAASWGCFFLTLLRLHEPEGLHPVPPELYLLPRWSPMHPSKLWCHARMVYLPMAWLYRTGARVSDTPLLAAIRRELYAEPYEHIAWERTRNHVADDDRLTERSLGFKVSQHISRAAQPWLQRMSGRALNEVLARIRHEDEATSYLCIGPVSKLYHTLVWHFVDPHGPELKRHLERLGDYLHTDEQGTRMNGYQSSELWDTALTMLAVEATERPAPELLDRARMFVARSQILTDPADHTRFDRDITRGGWPFSRADNGWPVTDCTALGLLTTLAMRPSYNQGPLHRHRLAVDRLLGWQNADGGWASYEKTRGGRWLERLNPSDVFANIMVDQSHVECTATAMMGLAAYGHAQPDDRPRPIAAALDAGVRFLTKRQRADGSWEGAWGVCFTYGTWFATEGLAAAHIPASDARMQDAADFLLAHQLPDGGWGELATGCAARRYVSTTKGQPVQTAWALMALRNAGRRGASVQRAIAFLQARQGVDGTWAQDTITGVFNRTCTIHYHAYPAVFPLWALARCRDVHRST